MPKQTSLIANQENSVGFVRDELSCKLSEYNLIEDCLDGSSGIKSKGDVYLPRPNRRDSSNENLDRYDSYLERAVFYNVAQNTLLGLLGEIFSRDPTIEVPKVLETVITDSNGAGISMLQESKEACRYVLGCGRGGLFVDYPQTNGVTSKAEQAAGNIRPKVKAFKARDVINWRYYQKGTKLLPSMVVLRENYTVQDDGFETIKAPQYRELRIIDGRYRVQLWRAKANPDGKVDPKATNFEVFETSFPTDGKGEPLDEIPFTFIGSLNNDETIDPSPMLDICNINIGHYHNSADYEEMIFIIGQPTLCVIGLTSEWFDKILGKRIPFGSRSGLALPVGADAKLIQVQDSTLAFQAMEHKEKQMIALGAKIVQEKSVQVTATQTKLDNASEKSTLVSVAKNVSAAFQWALEWCAIFSNVDEKAVKFLLNTDFDLAKLSDEDLAKIIKSWQDGAISWTEMRDMLRKAGRTTQDDVTAKGEIEADQAKAIETAAAEMAATTAAVTENSPPPAGV